MPEETDAKQSGWYRALGLDLLADLPGFDRALPLIEATCAPKPPQTRVEALDRVILDIVTDMAQEADVRRPRESIYAYAVRVTEHVRS